MSSVALLEAEIPSPLYVTGKNKVVFFWAFMVAVVPFPLFMDMVEMMVVHSWFISVVDSIELCPV